VKVLVTGAAGQVGSEVVADLRRRSDAMVKGPGLDVIAATHSEIDVSSRDSVMSGITALEPDVVIHAAAWTAVDACEGDPDRAYAVNALGTRHVAEASRFVGAHLAYVSTDYVFDGTSARPYREWDATNPLSVYGASKLGGEHELAPSATIVRTSWVCGIVGGNMVKTVLRLARSSDGVLRFVDDQRGSPSVASDLASTLIDLALARRPGIFHVSNAGETSWFGLAQFVLVSAGLDPARVEPIRSSELDAARYPAPRPANSVLDNTALRLSGLDLLPDWQESIAELVVELAR
jgi:dTDP-4-dehydrorhamnose reductase